jgi:hypothetical protein
MRKYFVTAMGVAALALSTCVALADTTPAPTPPPTTTGHPHVAPWHAAEGKPTIDTGKTAAAYVWHEGDVAYIKVTDDIVKGQIWGGRIEVNGGTITNATRINDEKDDRIKQPKPNVLEFRFDTHMGVDGVKFTIVKDPNTTVKHPGIGFRIRVAKEPVQNLYYGKDATDGQSPIYFNFAEPKPAPAPANP